MPRRTPPRTTWPLPSMPCPNTNGAAASTLELRWVSAATRCHDAKPSSVPVTVTCGVIASIRVRTSFTNPFITLITVMSAAIPSAVPIIEASEMNEMKWLRRLARV
jgi:hypothetical protein